MREMPELEVRCEYLGPRLVGEEIAKVTVSPKFGFLLRTPPADLARALTGQTLAAVRPRGELKNLLRNQAFIAGIGNAYSDEILHAARMLPLRKRSSLRPQDVEALHGAVIASLADAVAKIRAQADYQPHKQDRGFMAVHLRGGEPCPRCGHRIAEIKARGEVFNYCRGCQK